MPHFGLLSSLARSLARSVPFFGTSVQRVCRWVSATRLHKMLLLSFSNRKSNGSRSLLLLLLWERDQIDLGL